MTAVLLAFVATAAVIWAGAHRLGQRAFLVALVPFVAALGYAASRGGGVLDGSTVTERVDWVPALGLTLSWRLDAFALLMTTVVAGIGVAIMVYGWSYFGPSARTARTAALLTLFAGAMVGVVLADSIGGLYLSWELTSIVSFLLIGGRHESAAARSAALHALLVTGAGGLALLGGLVVLAQEAGTTSISGILADPPSGTLAGVGLAFVVVGIVTKSAQYPMHSWLPAAMVAPTPISAYLHSATMVKAGIYLAARLAPAFALTAGWRPALLTIGLVTMLGGGLRALRQHDLKVLLAMGTVSQLGFLLVLFSAGTPTATKAGCVLLLAHALFKAALFLVVGIVDHQAGTRDRRELAGFGAGWGPVKVVAAIAAASMAGLPPILGFIAKESAFDAFLDEGTWGAAVLAGLVAGSILTVAYTVRFARTVLRPSRGAAGPPPPSLAFTTPAVVLAVGTVLFGLWVGLVEPLLIGAAASLDPGAAGKELALWHGFNLPLALSALVVAGGVALAWREDQVEGLLGRLALPRSGADAYAAAVRGLNLIARRTAGVAQSGSLPVYVGVIAATAVALPGSVLATRAAWPGWPELASGPAQVAAAALIGVAALGAASARRRLAAVLFLGGVGYGMGLLFVVQGAPDLALTQFAVETLTLVGFALVLRFLPRTFAQRPSAVPAAARLAISGAVAALVFAFAVISTDARRADPVGPQLVAPSLEEAGGRNVVNVTLVDFRGIDTLGEVSVLAVAALGVVALGRVSRRRPGGPS